jgi:hypothetical protein
MSRGACPKGESPAQRGFARSRPAEFLRQFADGAVIDEAQHAPELFSEMQGVVDASGRMGLFVLTGSQNLALLLRVTQSLAGRTALVELLPLSIAELRAAGRLDRDYASHLVKGFFPAIYSRDLAPRDWLQGYLVTYAERDARQLAAIQDLGAFQRFLKLSAARTGQLLNMQSLGSDAGVSDKTVKHWLSILQTCYLIRFVRPHVANFGKRLVKMPKLYLTDVGLAAALMGITEPGQVQAHPLRGALFETMVVNELLKARANRGLRGQHGHQPALGVFEAGVRSFAVGVQAAQQPLRRRKRRHQATALVDRLGTIGAVAQPAGAGFKGFGQPGPHRLQQVLGAFAGWQPGSGNVWRRRVGLQHQQHTLRAQQPGGRDDDGLVQRGFVFHLAKAQRQLRQPLEPRCGRGWVLSRASSHGVRSLG